MVKLTQWLFASPQMSTSLHGWPRRAAGACGRRGYAPDVKFQPSEMEKLRDWVRVETSLKDGAFQDFTAHGAEIAALQQTVAELRAELQALKR